MFGPMDELLLLREDDEGACGLREAVNSFLVSESILSNNGIFAASTAFLYSVKRISNSFSKFWAAVSC